MKLTFRFFPLLFLSSLLCGCQYSVDQEKADQKIRETILGDWVRINKQDSTIYPFPGERMPEGMTIDKDSIESYLGFYSFEDDSFSRRPIVVYSGNMAHYKVENGEISVKNPLKNSWEFKWSWVGRSQDTLQLAIDDTTTIQFKRLQYKPDTLPEFDQIIFSTSGCYGTCPIQNISITRTGDVLFQGEGYVKSTGYYSGKIDAWAKDFIFNKFRRANPLALDDIYAVTSTDKESITTTFIQNGKIVKTIYDYGMIGPRDLIWAYVPISAIHRKIKLSRLPVDIPYYPKLKDFAIAKGENVLHLEKSESFYLWTELYKSKRVSKEFKAKYKLLLAPNYTYWGPDPDKKTKSRKKPESLLTDGRFFTFRLEGENPITYDIGYNFIDRNFKPSDFRKPDK